MKLFLTFSCADCRTQLQLPMQYPELTAVARRDPKISYRAALSNYTTLTQTQSVKLSSVSQCFTLLCQLQSLMSRPQLVT